MTGADMENKPTVNSLPACGYASEDVAHWLGVRHADLLQSFNRMLEVWPDVSFEYTTAKHPTNGTLFPSILMTGATLAAFLYWRKCHGKPETIFASLRVCEVQR